jgi:hypothetical protein
MDEKEILQRQVDALEKLLQIKEAIIQEQDSKISKLENEQVIRFPQMPQSPPAFPQQPVWIPSVWTHDPCPANAGGHHEYRNPWHSINPQPCIKCGKTFPSSQIITSTNTAKIENV